MNILDIIICIIVGYCFIRGLFRGIIKEFASIAGVFVGFYAAYTYYPVMADKLSFLIPSARYQNIVGFLLIFCIVLVAAGFLGILIRYVITTAFSVWIDRLSGSLFGIIRGVLIVAIILMVLTAFLPKKAPIIKKSLLAPYIIRVSNELVEIASSDFSDLYDYFKENVEELEDAWL